MAKTGNAILHNKYLLYLIFAAACINLFYFASINDGASITIFFLVGFTTSFFSKNMIVILCIALAITHILKKGNYEGLENMEDPIAPPDAKNEANMKKTYSELHSSGSDLLSVQGEILKNFEVMNPLIKRAEDLVASMNKSIDNMSNIN